MMCIRMCILYSSGSQTKLNSNMIKIIADLILRKLEGLSGLHDLRSPISSRPILIQNTECDWLRSP